MKRSRVEYLFALPAFLVFFVFFIYPFLNGFWLSLTRWNGFTDPVFIGFENFQNIFDNPRAVNAIRNALIFAAFSAPLLNIVGLTYALLLEDTRSKLAQVTRALVYIPAIISPLIMGYVWRFIVVYGGTAHQLLELLYLDRLIFNWLAYPRVAMGFIIFINTWQFAGMTMIIYMASLQAIPRELHEAADVDGANFWQKLIKVKLPSITPAITINVLTNIIGSLAVFDAIVALTDGGPGFATESLSIYIMRMAFGGATGFAISVAIVMFFITLLPVATYIFLTKKKGLAI